jgi:hypothetical protein
MPVTVIVEPDYGGHRFQAVAHVAKLAGQTGEIILLTSAGAPNTDEFRTFLTDVPLKVNEPFESIYPPTRLMARRVAEICRTNAVSTVIVMDADQSLKRWWYVAAQELRGVPRRPRVIFMLTRYPAKLTLGDRFGWALRISKGSLALAAMATGTLHRVAGFAGREDLSRGWLVKRARDPAICTANSRDRTALRAELGLPADRRLVGIFGVLTARKNAPLVLAAILTSGTDADLLLAGSISPDVTGWLATLPEPTRGRVIVRDGFLPNDLLDRLVAAVDVVAIVLTNNGPSGIMGKALAADVPVVSAGSAVRARELHATHGGVTADLNLESIATALRRVLVGGIRPVPASPLPAATAEAFAAVLLGADPRQAAPARRPGAE